MYIRGLQLLPQTDKWMPVLPLFEIELEKKTKENNTQSKKLMFTQGAKSWESLFCTISPSETENASYTWERKRVFVPERVTALAVFLQDINKEGSNCFSTILLLSTFSSEKKSLFSHLGL